MMDVQIIQRNGNADLVHTLEEWDPNLLRLLREITPNSHVELVERNVMPLGVSPVGDYGKQVTGQEIIELAKTIALADDRVMNRVTNKLEVIAEQMNFLREQALRILKEGHTSMRLNHIPCNFLKVPGNTYYLYKRPSGQIYFSVLSPDDWRGKPPHTFCGSYIYGRDSSWIPTMPSEQCLL